MSHVSRPAAVPRGTSHAAATARRILFGVRQFFLGVAAILTGYTVSAHAQAIRRGGEAAGWSELWVMLVGGVGVAALTIAAASMLDGSKRFTTRTVALTLVALALASAMAGGVLGWPT